MKTQPESRWRYLENDLHDGAHNMAVARALWQACAEGDGLPTLHAFLGIIARDLETALGDPIAHDGDAHSLARE